MIRRLRFSIGGLLVLTLIVALVASNAVSYRRLRELEPALEKLRNEVGELTIRDAGLLHVIAVPSYEESTYRWRVHLPKGRKFTLHAAATEKIPDEGLPEGGSRDTFLSQPFDAQASDAQTLQTVAVNRGQDGRWRLILHSGDSQVSQRLPEELQSWLDASNGRSWSVTGKGKTISALSGKPLPLIRIRRVKELPGGAITVEMQPTHGILVWIEEDLRK